VPVDREDPTGKVLVVTNDFPPRRGGIESFVVSLCNGLPADRVVVYTARMPGSAAVDRRLDYPVVRDRAATLLPTPRVARAARRVMERHGCDRVLFGAAAPLALLATGLRAAGARRIVGLTHGHEVWWSKVPVVRRLLRRIGREVDVLTYVSDYCRRRIAEALRAADAACMVRLSPGVNTMVFRPDAEVTALRLRLGLAESAPVVLAASRLVARKGHDVLLSCWPAVLAENPGAVLLIAGDGPRRRRLARMVASGGLGGSVRLVPGVPWAEMPQVYGAGNVFALPCRTRLAGLEPEALGIAFLEAAAAGLPIVVGRSGGAPETVVDGDTGYIVDPRSATEVAARINALLADPGRAAQMGARGRARVARTYSPAAAVATLQQLLFLD
jgi:phosphatidylinositol alpha-1,6-mannosyltransferase